MSNTADEAVFKYDELFFSKTDPRGIIQAGNAVFQRVSEYSWDEMLGKPHSLIRHPDMPRAVFYLLWEYLKSGRPIGAFVKNRAKSGKHYWVFALALPAEGGFLSVRLKPGGDLLKVVEKEYQGLRAIERAKNPTPKDSADLLLARLKELGFESYDSFMIEALVDQLSNRCRETNVPVPSELSGMTELKTSAATISQSTAGIITAYRGSRFIPLNLEVNADKLGGEGRQISVVAHQYQQMVIEINREIENFEKMAYEVTSRVAQARFAVGAAGILREISRYLEKEAADSGRAADEGIAEVIALSRKYRSEAADSVYRVADVNKRFASTCDSLQTLGSGLELVRVTGKIESARLSSAGDVASLLEELKRFQVVLGDGLRHLRETNGAINQRSKTLLSQIS